MDSDSNQTLQYFLITVSIQLPDTQILEATKNQTSCPIIEWSHAREGISIK